MRMCRRFVPHAGAWEYRGVQFGGCQKADFCMQYSGRGTPGQGFGGCQKSESCMVWGGEQDSGRWYLRYRRVGRPGVR